MAGADARFEVDPDWVPTSRSDFSDRILIRCGICDHQIGHWGYWDQEPGAAAVSTLPSLINLDVHREPHTVPRFGLREGAYRKGRDPFRRPLPSIRRRFSRPKAEVYEFIPPTADMGATVIPVFYAYCLGCGAKNYVDTSRI